MKKLHSSASRILPVACALLLCLLAPSPARADAAQTFVSVSGTDANAAQSCIRSKPCRNIQTALDVTLPGGILTILDSATYGGFTITQSVEVVAAPGAQATVAPLTGDAVTINAPEASVTLRNLYLSSLGQNAQSGINAEVMGTLHVEGCTITGFNGSGLTTASGGRLFVKDTLIRNNVGVAIRLVPYQTSINASIDNCRMEKNNTGVYVQGLVSGSIAHATVRNSVAAENGNSGYNANGAWAHLNVFDSKAVFNHASGFQAQGGAKVSAQHSLSAHNVGSGFDARASSVMNVKDCTASNNSSSGMVASGTSARVVVEDSQAVSNTGSGVYVTASGLALVSDSMISGNAHGLRNFGGTIRSFGNNRVFSNTTNVSGTIHTIAQM